MMTADQVIAVCSTAVPVTGGLVAAVRQLVRILTSIERVTQVAEALAQDVQTHITTHDQADAALRQQLADHATALAVLHATGSTAPGAAGTPQ